MQDLDEMLEGQKLEQKILNYELAEIREKRTALAEIEEAKNKLHETLVKKGVIK